MPVLFNVPSSSGGGGGNSAVLQRTLLKENWVGENAPYTMTIPIKGITRSTIVELVIPSNVSEAVVDTYTDAQIMSGIQNSDEITIIAYGDKPQIDLPLTIIVRNELVADVDPEETGAGEFAKYAMKTQISNRNLLDNPWFTVNQRGNTTYTTNDAYTVDRWKLVNPLGSASVVKTENGVRLTTVTNDGIKQLISKEFLEIGKEYTISAIVNDMLLTSTFTWDGLELKSNYDLDEGLKYSIKIEENAYAIYPVTQDSGSARTDEVKAVKLELGRISTLMMDVIPDYTDELRKCLTSSVDSNDIYANKPVTLTSNPNLLDNPWFTVNQRGQSEYDGAGYTVDRWKLDTGMSCVITVEDDGLSISQEARLQGIFQYLENTLYGTFTLSIMFSDNSGVVEIQTENETGWNLDNASSKENNGILTVTGTKNIKSVCFSVHSGSAKVKAIKLEKGSVSTLSLDTKPNYGDELYKCITSTADSADTYSNQPNIIPEIKKSVSDGKAEVADAITTKGVATASDATFNTMATNILAIKSGTSIECEPITNFTYTMYLTKATFNWALPDDPERGGIEIWTKEGDSNFSDTPSGLKIYDSNTIFGTDVTTCDYEYEKGTTDYYATIYTYTYMNNSKQYVKGKTLLVRTGIKKGFVKILTSGTFTVPAGVTSIDLFLVGGGASGSAAHSSYAGNGGSGGKIHTVYGINVNPDSEYNVTIGSGGATSTAGYGAHNYGGSTSFGSYSSDSGSTKANGGSGNGTSSGGKGQDGQYAFGDSSIDGIKYGAGGGGAASGSGGATGGGNGGSQSSYNGYPASSNTGSGGGGGYPAIGSGGSGGSGICIVRWGY